MTQLFLFLISILILSDRNRIHIFSLLFWIEPLVNLHILCVSAVILSGLRDRSIRSLDRERGRGAVMGFALGERTWRGDTPSRKASLDFKRRAFFSYKLTNKNKFTLPLY